MLFAALTSLKRITFSIQDSPPPTATSASKHLAFQARAQRHKLTQPSSHNQSQTLATSISFKQPWSPAVPNNIQPSHKIPVQRTLQRLPWQSEPAVQPRPLLSSEAIKLLKQLSQERPQPSPKVIPTQKLQLPPVQQIVEHSPQAHQPKRSRLQQHRIRLPPLVPSPKLPLPVPQSQQNADQSQNLSHQLPELSNKPSPQQLSIQSHELPDDHQSPQLSPQLSHQPSRQPSGSDSPHDQSPPPSPHQPVSLSPPPNLHPLLAQSPLQQTRYTLADVLKLMRKESFNILLFRITLYLGFIFDGHMNRKHPGQSLATYEDRRNGATLQITDTFGPEINESILPDLILMCLPLSSDIGIQVKEKEVLQVMKNFYKNNCIWNRVVIALTVPDSDKNKLAEMQKRQNDIEQYMRSIEIQTIPPFICISDKLSDPKPTWYTELWSAIFKHCSEDGCPTLHVHLTDRLTGTSTTTRSCLPKIPRESIKILEKRIEEYQSTKYKTQKMTVSHTSHPKPLWAN